MKSFIFIFIGILYFLGFFLFIDDIKNLNYSFLKSNIFDYSISILNGLFAFIISFYIFKILINKIDTILKNIKSNFKYKKISFDLILKFLKVSKFILSFYLALQVLILPKNILLIIDKFFKISFIIAFLILLTSFISNILKELEKKENKTSIGKQVFPIIDNFLIVFIWIIGIITIISNLGYNVSALITGAGVGGLAIALAAQKTISNIFGALSVIINRPFKIGDFITIGNYTGTVKDIGLTYLKLISEKGNKILIPNENIISSSIENLTQRENRREDMTIGLTYYTSLEKLKTRIKIIENLLESKKENITNFIVHFASFGDFSLNIEYTYFTNIEDIKTHQKLKEEINLKIKKLFEEEKIEIAFPKQTLYINNLS